jgi:hypothetical protein
MATKKFCDVLGAPMNQGTVRSEWGRSAGENAARESLEYPKLAQRRDPNPFKTVHSNVLFFYEANFSTHGGVICGSLSWQPVQWEVISARE